MNQMAANIRGLPLLFPDLNILKHKIVEHFLKRHNQIYQLFLKIYFY